MFDKFRYLIFLYILIYLIIFICYFVIFFKYKILLIIFFIEGFVMWVKLGRNVLFLIYVVFFSMVRVSIKDYRKLRIFFV